MYNRNLAIGPSISPEFKSQSGNTVKFQVQKDLYPVSGLVTIFSKKLSYQKSTDVLSTILLEILQKFFFWNFCFSFKKFLLRMSIFNINAKFLLNRHNICLGTVSRAQCIISLILDTVPRSIPQFNENFTMKRIINRKKSEINNLNKGNSKTFWYVSTYYHRKHHVRP